MARTFMQLIEANRVSGLFLSSGVCGSPDATMAKMLGTVEILRRRYNFRGFIHLKVIPGASEQAIEQAVRLATRVSVNIEAPSAEHLAKLSGRKRFHEDIISAMRTIQRLRAACNRRCGQTTQFVVGAAGETDRQIITATDRLYRGFGVERVYYSAYQDVERMGSSPRGLLFDDAPGGRSRPEHASFVREHRLYQVDFLLRKYGFSRDEIVFGPGGSLSPQLDPKRVWAERHPEFFPVDVSRAERWQLLRVPGIGPVGADRIVQARRAGRIDSIESLSRLGVKTSVAERFVTLGRGWWSEKAVAAADTSR